MKKELLNGKWALHLSFLLFSAAIFIFSINKAIAKPDGPAKALHEENTWIYVQDGKVYYFEQNGRLCFRNLSDATYRVVY